jgi:hypothetical protein
VELTGFEPVAPSLRKMRSKSSDQGKRHPLEVLWSVCGTSGVSRGETQKVNESHRPTRRNPLSALRERAGRTPSPVRTLWRWR